MCDVEDLGGEFWLGELVSVFVLRGVEHRFIEITQELVLLVVFGPAEWRG